jgi:serine/threonine protein kinase
MGAVFKAHDAQLDRQVALKVPFLGDNDADTRQRFYREARAAATLQHANICPVFDVGEFEGIPYLTMAFIDGRPLSQALLAGQTFSPTQIALLIRKLALAMNEAHSRGVIHRDLKPSNVLLRPNLEPVIMDFGLARRADDKRSEGLTHQGDVIGTIDYMSPEQVEGDNAVVGPASDIYALGVILFELLTRRVPFEGTTTNKLASILVKTPPRPSEIRVDVPPKLEEICLKAMARKATDRYTNMGQIAAALGEFLRAPQGSGVATVPRMAEASATPPPSTTQPIVPPPASSGMGRAAASTIKPAAKSGIDRGMSSARRKSKAKDKSYLPMVLAGVAVAVLVIGVPVGIAAIFWPRGEGASTHKTNPIPPAAGGPNNQAQGSQFRPNNNSGTGPSPNVTAPTTSGLPNNPAKAGPPKNETPAPQPASTSGAFALRLQPEMVPLTIGQAQQVTIKIERRDYKGPIQVNWTAPKDVRVTPVSPLTVRGDQPDPVLTILALSQPGAESVRFEISASASEGGNRKPVKSGLDLRIAAGACVRVSEIGLPANMDIEAMAFAPDTSMVLLGGGAHADAPRGGSGGAAGGGTGGGNRGGLAGLRDRGGQGGGDAAGGGNAGGNPNPGGGNPGGGNAGGGNTEDRNAIYVWNLERGEVISKFSGHSNRVTALAISTDGKTAFSASADDTVALWDLLQGKQKVKSPKQPARVIGMAMSPDAKRALIVYPGVVAKINLSNFGPGGKPISSTVLMGIKADDAVRAQALSADHKYGVIGGMEGKLFLIDMTDKTKPKPLVGHKEIVLSAAFSPMASLVATGGGGVLQLGSLRPGQDNAVRLWDATTGTMKWSADGHTHSVVFVAFSADGQLVASGSSDGEIRIWKVEDGSPVATLSGHTGRILALAFTSDGKQLWSGADDRTLRQWRLP